MPEIPYARLNYRNTPSPITFFAVYHGDRTSQHGNFMKIGPETIDRGPIERYIPWFVMVYNRRSSILLL